MKAAPDILYRGDRTIPSLIGPDQGWKFVRRIDYPYGHGCVYDVEDGWRPTDTTVGHCNTIFEEVVFYTKARNGEKAGIDWDKVPLGEYSDADLAEMLGVSISTVSHARHQRHVLSKKRRQCIDWDKQPLGKMPDSKLAKKLGVSHSAVQRARLDRKIPTFKKCG